MEIDSTPFDVAVRLDDEVAGRIELTALVDVHTRYHELTPSGEPTRVSRSASVATTWVVNVSWKLLSSMPMRRSRSTQTHRRVGSGR